MKPATFAEVFSGGAIIVIAALLQSAYSTSSLSPRFPGFFVLSSDSFSPTYSSVASINRPSFVPLPGRRKTTATTIPGGFGDEDEIERIIPEERIYSKTKTAFSHYELEEVKHGRKERAREREEEDEEEKEEEELEPLNESCWLSTSCDDLASLAPPPDVIASIPPPPLPLFLFESEILLLHSDIQLENWSFEPDFNFDYKNYYLLERHKNDADEMIVFRINHEWLAVDRSQKCSVCPWAKTNSTGHLFTRRHPFSVSVANVSSWIETLIGVAFISAVLGASLTCILLKLRNLGRLKFLCGIKDSSSAKTRDGGRTEAVRKSSVVSGSSANRGLSSDKSCQKQIRPNYDCPEGNSAETEGYYDVEELYINAKTLSALYSDLPSISGQSTFEDRNLGSPVSTYYSDVSNVIFANSSGSQCKTLTKTCEDHKRCAQSGCRSLPTNNSSSFSSPSSSAPSSAYYSDVSVCEIQASRKKKKKRKVDHRAFHSVSESSSLPVSSFVPSMPKCVYAGQNCSSSIIHAALPHCMRPVPSMLQPLPGCIQSLSNCFQASKSSTHPNYPHSMSSCGQTNLTCVQSTPSSISSPPSSINLRPLPSFVRISPSCVRHIPNFMMFKNCGLNNNFVQAHCLANCESVVTVLFNSLDTSSPPAVDARNTYETKGQCTKESQRYHFPRDCSVSKPDSGAVHGKQRYADAVPQCSQQHLNDVQKIDYEVYRENVEIPSEYI